VNGSSPTKMLGDLTIVQSGGTPTKSCKEYWGGTIPWYSSGELNHSKTSVSKELITELGLNESNAKVYPEGSLLIGMYDTAALKMSILDRDAAFNQAIAAVMPKDDLDLDFVLYAINSNKKKILSQRRGVRQKNLNLTKIKQIAIPFLPLAEQKRIVAIIDEAFAAIDAAVANTENNLANARELFESYLNAVFTQKGDGWVETSLGKEIDLLTGFAFKSKNYTEAQDGIKLLRGDNIVQEAFRWEKVKRWPKSEVETYSKFTLEENDIVLAMDRTWVKAGLKYAVISEADLPCLLVQRVARIRANEDLDNTFLKHLIGSSEFTRYVLSIQTGLGVPHISGTQIKNFNFSKPHIADQKDIASKADELLKKTQRLEAIYQQKLKALAELKQSILQKAFAGELTTLPEKEIEEANA